MKSRLNCGAMAPYLGEGGEIVICRVASQETGATDLGSIPTEAKYPTAAVAQHASAAAQPAPKITVSNLLLDVNRRICFFQSNLKWLY